MIRRDIRPATATSVEIARRMQIGIQLVAFDDFGKSDAGVK